MESPCGEGEDAVQHVDVLLNIYRKPRISEKSFGTLVPIRILPWRSANIDVCDERDICA